MTMKTTKTGSTILSRVGVGAFLAAALAATAPISFAGDPEAKTVEKKVMKWVENENGVETTKHIEVTKENGVTTAYSIDEHGNKTVIDASEIDMIEGMNAHDQVRALLTLDGKVSGKHTEYLMDGDQIYVEDGGGTHSKIMITHVRKNADGQIVNRNVEGFGSETSAIVSAAQSLLDQADDKDLSSKTRRKLDKARKALKEAQEALEAEE